MTAYSLFPTAIQVDYTTAYGRHKQTIPVNAWNPPSSGHDAGTLTAWDASQKDVIDMMDTFFDVWKVFFPSTTSFDGYTVLTYADADAPGLPQIEVSTPGVVGTGAAGTPAAQANFQFRTTGFHPFKLVMLDIAPGANFLPVTSFPSPAYDTTLDLLAVIIDDANAFRGRDNNQVAVLRKVTYTLNEKLRKSYRLD